MFPILQAERPIADPDTNGVDWLTAADALEGQAWLIGIRPPEHICPSGLFLDFTGEPSQLLPELFGDARVHE
jgi:hypothetical protein